MKFLRNSKTFYVKIMCALLMSIEFSPAFASGGLNTVNALMEKLATVLRGVSIATIVVAIMIVGYKTLFNGDSIRECKNWIIGGVLIVAASEIARLFA